MSDGPNRYREYIRFIRTDEEDKEDKYRQAKLDDWLKDNILTSQTKSKYAK